MSARRFRGQGWVLALFVVLAVAHTWPLATAPAVLSRNDTADTVLNEWVLAWVAHQSVNDPLNLFEANIFYPERRTLAFSEHLFVQAMMGAPLLWAGASPVLVYNLLLMAGFALTGWATSVMIERWTGDRLAGIVAGCLAAFNAHTLTRLPHIQAQHVEFLPLALIALDRLLDAPRIRHAAALAGWWILQSLTSGYFVVFTALAVAAGILARPADWLRQHFVPFARAFALTIVLAAVALLPFLAPYYLVRRDQGLRRTIEEVGLFSAQPRHYLATGGTLHYSTWSQPFFGGDALFPGVTALALLAVAVGSRAAFRDRRARMCLVLGASALYLSFGPALPGYRWLYEHIALLQGMRGAARFGQIVLFAVAALAGFGLAWARARLLSTRWRVGVALAALALVNVEALRAPFAYTPFGGIPRIYNVLAAEPRAVLAEFPFHPAHESFRNVTYMLGSVRHWKPLLNGYSGFVPRSYREHARALADFPSERATAYLRASGVTHVVVHMPRLPRAVVDQTQDSRALSLVITDGNIRIYRLLP